MSSLGWGLSFCDDLHEFKRLRDVRTLGTVAHTTTDYVYSLALGVHLSKSASLMSDLLRSPDPLKGVDTNHFKTLLESARDSQDHAVVTVDCLQHTYPVAAG